MKGTWSGSLDRVHASFEVDSNNKIDFHVNPELVTVAVRCAVSVAVVDEPTFPVPHHLGISCLLFSAEILLNSGVHVAKPGQETIVVTQLHGIGPMFMLKVHSLEDISKY